MSNHSELGTYWSGRILVSARFFDIEEPQCIVKPISDKELSENQDNDDILYGIQVDAFYGLQLPENSNKYSLTVRWADYYVQTKKIEQINGLIEWFEVWKYFKIWIFFIFMMVLSWYFYVIILNKRVKIDCKLPYKSSETLPDIFIYLTDTDGKHASYLRENPKKYLSSNSMIPENFYLLPDKSMTRIRSEEAGVINATIIISYEGC